MLSNGNNYIEPNATRLRAVDGGYFYRGKVDTDPTITANQIPIYYKDESGTEQQVEQPIYLNKAGVPVLKNGNAFEPIGSPVFSFSLFDKTGKLIEYNASTGDPANMSEVIESQDRMMGYAFKGDYLPDPVTLTNEGDYVLDDNGNRWFGVSTPYTTNPNVQPESDPNLTTSYVYLTTNRYAPIKEKLGSQLNKNLTNGDVVVSETLPTEIPIPIPSNSKLSGEKSHIYTIGTTFDAVNAITKTTNATVTLNNQDPNTSEITLDCILYTDPAWVDGKFFPQGVNIESLAIHGDAPNPVEAGYFVLQGNLNISGRIAGCVRSVWAKDIWSSKIEDFTSFGAIVIERGTSTLFNRVWSIGHESVQGAFHLEGFTYAELTSCGSDGAPNGAYYFDSCKGLTLTSCGAEKASVVSPDTAQYMTFGSGNLISINGGSYAPSATPDIPIVSLIGDSNRITINGANHNIGIAYEEPDYYIKGTGNILEVFSGNYRVTGGGVDFPKIWIEPTATDSKVFVHLKDGNRVLYKNGGAKETPFVEYERISGTASPRLTFGGTDSATYTVKTGYFTKNADLIVFNFEFAISSRGAASGVIEIIDLPYAPVFVHSAVAASFSGAAIEDGGIFLKTNVANKSIELYRAISLETQQVTAGDVTDAFTITGSITYRMLSYFNE